MLRSLMIESQRQVLIGRSADRACRMFLMDVNQVDPPLIDTTPSSKSPRVGNSTIMAITCFVPLRERFPVSHPLFDRMIV